jgi:hypothetical protein
MSTDKEERISTMLRDEQTSKSTIPSRSAPSRILARLFAGRATGRASGGHGGWLSRRSLWVAAALIAVGGYVHLCLYRHGYKTIPKIGAGFLLNVIASALIAVALLVRRDALIRLAGIGLSSGTLLLFGLTRTPAGLFNFREVGFQPSPQAPIAFAVETTALLLLLSSFALDRRRAVGRIL